MFLCIFTLQVASLPSDEFDFTNTRNIEDSLVQSKMSANTKRSC